VKLTKMSLIAALLVGSSAFAIDNVKTSGDAKLFYSTNDGSYTDKNKQTQDSSLFEKETSMAQAALALGLTADLDKNVKATVHMTALSTVGLEGQLVNSVWEGTNGTTDSYWFDQAFLSTNIAKTAVQIGRMKLDTPLVKSEEWSVATNTFDAAVVINKDLPDTTLVGAYVGASNGMAEKPKTAKDADGKSKDINQGSVIADFNANGTSNFSQFYQGAFAAGLVNNSWKPLTVQAWYYNATHVATAYFVEADLKFNNVLAGAQYTSTDLEGQDEGKAGALMIGYELKDIATLKVAYSKVGSANNAGANLSGSGASSLYTASWWTSSWASTKDTESYSFSAEGNIASIDLGLYVVKASQGSNDAGEATVTATKSFDKLDVTAAYIYTNDFTTDGVNTIQTYLTYNF